MAQKKLKETLSFNIQADVPTPNGNIYPKAVLKKAIADYKKHKVKSRMSICEIKKGPYEGICALGFIVEDITMNNDGKVTGKIKTLETDCGKELKKILKSGKKVKLTIDGVGQIDEKSRIVTEFELRQVAIVTLDNRDLELKGGD